MMDEMTMKKRCDQPIGAFELIAEYQQLLAGRRTSITPLEEYVAQRRRYWQMQAQKPHRHRSSLPRRAA